MASKSFFEFTSDGVTFTSSQALGIKSIYAPLCSPDASGLKSAISASLSGDIKIDKFHYVTKPASREDLRVPLREFFVYVKGKGAFNCFGQEGVVTVGQLWHQLSVVHKSIGLQVTVLNCVPVTGENVELMRVTVKNVSRKTVAFSATGAVPIFARSLANKHDHEHVTALLNRVEQVDCGVVVEPTMAFNEEGHKNIESAYFVFGTHGNGAPIAGSFPTVDAFYGDGGTLLMPEAVLKNVKPALLSDKARQGKEVVGALRFKEETLKPGASKDFILAIGMASSKTEAIKVFRSFNTSQKFEKALQANMDFWASKVNTIQFHDADARFNAWMRWVTLQPILRRIFGCSFLPDHDYGKGGKGWRDIWQDLLSLILIEPDLVREHLINNCAGIRIDGSNATIIGTKPGEFIADRNAITRVWMDHGCWPLLTLLLYINQTGDADILFESQTYFRDPQMSRTFEKDIAWVNQYGNKLLDKNNHVHQSTLLEHVLVQNLVQFFNVGEHNVIRLESADWNDGLDMAFAKGESVAFMSFYGGNLNQLADVIEDVSRRKKTTTLRLTKEVCVLMDTLDHPVNYEDHKAKHALLFGKYFAAVQPAVSGTMVDVPVADIVKDLRHKAQWIFKHVRRQEKIQITHKGKRYSWFNGYYDNQGCRVEGLINNRVRMTLTGQVFAIMSGMAQDDDMDAMIDSVNAFLKDPNLGGYRLNTDFGVRHYLDLGRAFGFAYGTKENGAFFSHMIVMYAYALYSRRRAREGYRVIQSIYQMAHAPEAKIYPGIPEYFDSEGRGMYHYLTGSASWLILTVLTQSFGVRGLKGDLLIAPQLVKEQFDAKGQASVFCHFDGKPITVEFQNTAKKDAGKYAITNVLLNGKSILDKCQISAAGALIPKTSLVARGKNTITITLA